MVQRHKENFASWDNLTKELQVGTDSKITTSSDPLTWRGELPNTTNGEVAKTTTLPGVFLGTSKLTMYGRFNSTGAGSARMILYAYDGVKYIGGGLRYNASGSLYGIMHVNSSSNAFTGGVNYDIEYWNFNHWTWLKVIINGTSLEIWYAKNWGTIKPSDSDWVHASTVDATITQMTTVTEIGAGFFEGVGALNESYIDDLEIFSDVGGGSEDSGAAGLILGDAELVEFFGNSAIGAGGVMSFIIADNGLANIDTILANNLGNEISIYDTTYFNVLFRGEIADFNIVGDSLLELIADEGGRKLLNQNCNHNPIIASGFLQYLFDDTQEDVAAAYTNTAAWVSGNYPLSCEKAEANQIIINPYLISFDTAVDGENGSVKNLYFDNLNRLGAGSYNNQHHVTDTDHDVSSYSVYYDFYLHVKNGSTLQTLSLKFKAQITGIQNASSEPSLNIHDIQNSQNDLILTLDESTGSTREVDGEFIIDETISSFDDYMVEVGAENDSGFQKFRIRIVLVSGISESGIALAIHTYYAELTAVFDNAQTSAVGIGKITTGTDSSTIVCDPAPSWALDDFPLADGFGKEDIFYVTKWMDAIFVDIFAAYDGTFTLDQNVTGLDELAEARNLEQELVYDILQKYSTLLNSLWWYNGLNKIVHRSLDNLLDTGITLTEVDAIGGKRAINIKISTDLLRNKLIINGDLVSGETAIEPEYTLSQGDEIEIYEDSTINTSKHITEGLINKTFVHKYASKYATVPISFTNPVQDYSTVALGSEIGLKYPNAEVDQIKFDFTVGGLGILIIVDMGIQSSKDDGWNQKITLGLQRRNNS